MFEQVESPVAAIAVTPSMLKESVLKILMCKS